MAELNHTIVRSRDKRAGAAYLAEILALEARHRSGRSRSCRPATG